MGSATSHKPHVALGPRGIQREWPVFVCQQGAFLFDPRAHHPVDPAEALVEYSDCVLADPRRGFVALPPCRDKDRLLNQPALGLQLSQDEAEKLIADTTAAAGAIAATDVGPVGQDKESNQDFALAATIRVPRNGGAPAVYQFAAVADGVTTRTLWPERSARLAAFTAWRVARMHVEAGRDFSHERFESFRDLLVSEIRRCLKTDRAILLNAGQIPAGWSQDAYEQFKGRPELWYNSTLHVVLVGPDAGFALCCGDGGFVVRKHENRQTKSVVLVRSTDDVSVSGIVSLAPNSMRFRQTRITVNPGTNLDIIMATDGVDRSLRRDAGRDDEEFDPYGADFVDSPSSTLLKAFVDAKLGQISNREIDNISSAVVHWPPPAVLPAPQAPAYAGPIAGKHDDVEAINARMAESSRPPVLPADVPPGAPSPLAARTVSAPIESDFRSSAPAFAGLSQWNETEPVPSAGMSRPSTHDLRDADVEGIAADIKNAIARTLALRQKLNMLSFQDYATIFEQLFNCIPTINIGGSCHDRKIGFPIFCKLMFFLMADQYARPKFNTVARGQASLDRIIDEFIYKACGSAPNFSKNDIDFSRSFDVVMRVLDILRTRAAADLSIKAATEALTRL